MWRVTLLLSVISATIMAACSAPSVEAPAERPEIKSTDFVLLPCGPGEAESPCTLLMAGGKRVLFGAPAGVADTLTQEDLANLDAVMLFSLNGRDIEGLDEVRNESWLAGRDAPLPVSGPEGTEDVIAALNLAYEQSDALAYVERGAKGGFDAAVLALGGTDGRAFYTGDLSVESEGFTGMIYTINYNGLFAQLSGCSDGETVNAERNDLAFTLGCNNGEFSWPLGEVVFVK